MHRLLALHLILLSQPQTSLYSMTAQVLGQSAGRTVADSAHSPEGTSAEGEEFLHQGMWDNCDYCRSEVTEEQAHLRILTLWVGDDRVHHR